MIFVRMRQHDAGQIPPLLNQVADVGKDKINAGKMLFRCKRDAEIDRKPSSAVDITQSVQGEIHPDLAHSAQWRENKFSFSRHHCGPLPAGPVAAWPK
jgi:hypothetical protein